MQSENAIPVSLPFRGVVLFTAYAECKHIDPEQKYLSPRHFLLRMQSVNAVDQAYREQNLMSLANACRRWWQAARGLQNAERHAKGERPVSA